MPIYTDKVTYGQSNTPSESHFIDGSTPNVLSIKRGTPLAPGAEVLKVSAGVVSFPQGTYGGLTLGTAQATTSGTSIDFTGIPSWAKRITVMLSGVSTNGADNQGFRLGTSGGIVSTGYLGSGSVIANPPVTTVYTSGMFFPGASATNVYNGKVVFTLLDVATNTWVGEASLALSSGPYNTIAATSIALASPLTTVRLTTVNGTDTFDAGSVNIMYEG